MIARRKILAVVFATAGLSLSLFYTNCSMDPGTSSGNSGLSAGCNAPAGLGSPGTIDEVVKLINALPKPLSLPCFLESLDRPLGIYATASNASAQPAFSTRSPRIFLFSKNLIISIVPEGPDSDLIEFSELRGTTRSVKGELRFPIGRNLVRSAAFDRVRLGNGTKCGTCHLGEGQDSTITYAQAFSSNLIKPLAALRIDPVFLVNEQQSCNSAAEPYRCSMLNGIFSFGLTNEVNFGQ